MQKDPKTNKWTYAYTFTVSTEKRHEMESCAKKNNMTVNKFIKDSIDIHLKILKEKNETQNTILNNQLELF
jgi:hypothetical protein